MSVKGEPMGLADESDAGWEKRLKSDSRIDARCFNKSGVEGATKEEPVLRKMC